MQYISITVAIGSYGVTSYVVGQRCRALGIRLTLGATPENIRALTVRRAVHTDMSGLAIGAASAATLGQMLQHTLRGVADREAQRDL